jgi:hypothetical protein
MPTHLKRLIVPVTCCLMLGSCNPFAPAYDPEGLDDINVLGDPSTIEGFFLLFKNAYELRDTTLYGQLFTQDFTFAYYDFDLGQEISWDRATELNISYNLFQSVQQINLDWNYYPPPDTTFTEAYVLRNFNLSIEEDEQTAFVGTGRAKLRLRRNGPGAPWKAYYWFDDSDF